MIGRTLRSQGPEGFKRHKNQEPETFIIRFPQVSITLSTGFSTVNVENKTLKYIF